MGSEVDLYPPLLRYFRRADWAFAEVPLYEKRIDLAFYAPRTQRLCAIEVKLGNWRGAFKQAAVDQVGFPYCYVALPLRLARKVALRERPLFEKHGVGLLGIDGVPRIMVPAQAYDRCNTLYMARLKETLGEAGRTQEPQTFAVLAQALSRRSRRMTLLERNDGDG